MQLRLIGPDGTNKELTVSATIVRFGRDPRCEVAFDPTLYPKISGVHAILEVDAAGIHLTPVSVSNTTFLNDQPLTTIVAVTVGDRIRLGQTGPTIEIVELDRTIAGGATIQADSADMALLRGSAGGTHRYVVQPGSLIGRDREKVQILLDHPHVSRVHARLTATGGRTMLDDLRSANGTYVNGRRIAQSVALKLGDRIDIGPYSLVFEDGALVSRSRSNNIELVSRGLNRIVKDRATGRPVALLSDIDLVIRPREFVCLLGPSGSGKSTLLTVLSGRHPPEAGSVSINGLNLYEHFDAMKQEIAVVPQRDVLHESLAVGAALRFTAQLRLPPDTGKEEIDSAVTDILDVVNLSDRRHTLIRHLSGGQIKRTSLANELMARPSLLFIDEVTSGLDEQTDREMMELFRRVADSGKTVVCITHNLANVEASCHLVVILTEGGRLAFVGTPDEAKEYFGIRRLGDVYQRLAEHAPMKWQMEFEKSSYHTRYVKERMPAPAAPQAISSSVDSHLLREHPKIKSVGQASILTRRYLAIWRGDAPALITLLGQSLLVAFLLCLVFGDIGTLQNPVERVQRTLNLLFLLTVSSFWFGCNTAAKELVKERVIFARERGFNLRVDSYLSSKFAVLLLIGLAQVTLLFSIVRLWCAPPGEPLLQWLVFVALMVAGTTLGLLLSGLAKTEEVAAALVPIAVIPQIILAGVIAPLSGLSKALAWIGVTCYHGQGAVESLLPSTDRALVGLAERSVTLNLLTACTHVGIFGLATWILLVYQTRQTSRT